MNGNNGNNENNENSILHNPWIMQIGSTLVSAIIVAILAYFFSVWDILPSVRAMQKNSTEIHQKVIAIEEKQLVAIEKSIRSIQDNYLKKDEQGFEVIVGINDDLKRNEVSVYKSNKHNLIRDDSIWVTNDSDTFRPTIFMRVVQEKNKAADNSDAEMFINEESAKKLGVTDFSKGVFHFYVKIQEKKNNNNNNNNKQ